MTAFGVSSKAWLGNGSFVAQDEWHQLQEIVRRVQVVGSDGLPDSAEATCASLNGADSSIVYEPMTFQECWNYYMWIKLSQLHYVGNPSWYDTEPACSLRGLLAHILKISKAW